MPYQSLFPDTGVSNFDTLQVCAQLGLQVVPEAGLTVSDTPELHAQDFMQPQPGVQGPMLSLSSGMQNTLQLHPSAVA